jgi:SAM-dependent methyltransferase
MKIIRDYNNYQKYISHQKEKSLNAARIEKWLNEDWLPKVEMFLGHFKRNIKYLNGGKALGVCARTGQEVEALNELGMDAIGIDIVPYPPLVILGDAHNLPFKDAQFDFVFSNSLDHSIHPKVFLNEIKRVLKVGGYGMLHLQITNEVDLYAENIILDEKDVLDVLEYQEIAENRDIADICYNREIIFKKVF